MNKNVNQLIKSHYNLSILWSDVDSMSKKNPSQIYFITFGCGFFLWKLLWFTQKRSRKTGKNGRKWNFRSENLPETQKTTICMKCIVVSIIICKQIKTDNIKFGFLFYCSSRIHCLDNGKWFGMNRHKWEKLRFFAPILSYCCLNLKRKLLKQF